MGMTCVTLLFFCHSCLYSTALLPFVPYHGSVNFGSLTLSRNCKNYIKCILTCWRTFFEIRNSDVYKKERLVFTWLNHCLFHSNNEIAAKSKSGLDIPAYKCNHLYLWIYFISTTLKYVNYNSSGEVV